MGVIPVVAVVLLMIFSSSSKPPKKPPPKVSKTSVVRPHTPKKVAAKPTPKPVKKTPVAQSAVPSDSDVQEDVFVESKLTDDEVEYNAILAYIRRVFKTVSEEDAQSIAKYLVAYGKEHQLDPKFAAAVIARESGFNKRAISVTGAKGLGQIKSFNFDSLKIKDPYNVKDNVSGTVQYLKRMLKNWNKDTHKGTHWKTEKEKVGLALASYYQGYGAMSRKDGKMDEKTRGYVDDIMGYYDEIVKVKQELLSKPN